MELPLYTLTLDNINFDGITGISIVDEPAIEEYFMKFSKENQTEINIINEEKRIITGPALIPNKKIFRRVEGNEFNVMFEKDAIEHIRNNFLINFKQQNVNLQHGVNANDISVVESWIIRNSSNDAANEMGFNLPAGTWMVSMKVDNDLVWEAIKAGEFKGFSIEAWFTSNLIEEKIKTNDEDIFNDIPDVHVILNELEELINENEELGKTK